MIQPRKTTDASFASLKSSAFHPEKAGHYDARFKFILAEKKLFFFATFTQVVTFSDGYAIRTLTVQKAHIVIPSNLSLSVLVVPPGL